MDISLNLISMVAIVLAVIAIMTAIFAYRSRGRAQVLLSQPYLQIDEVTVNESSNGRRTLQIRVINNNGNPFQFENFTVEGYDFTTDFKYGKPAIDAHGIIEHDVIYLNIYIEPNTAFNSRLLIRYRDFNNELHTAQSVQIYVERGQIAHDIVGTRFILTRRKAMFQ